MTIPAGNILLYPADSSNYDMAMAAASIAGVPISPNVLGDFYDIWNHTESGEYLVITVGANANNALYYNPCGWSNPAGDAGGSTPFAYASEPQSSLPGANYYENGAGTTALGTLKLVTMLAYYAVNGSYPSGWGDTLPATAVASNTCSSSMSSDQGCTC
ncbi:hypothetical protein ACOJUR_14070 [Alicyclobacillus tolerans]|uniref:hypothetical protein n=1 Tax=Alicyclobacillus tolerans TaxID=90970 RepID=UPI003B81B1FC